MDSIDGAMTAADLIRKSTVGDLSRLLRKNGDVRRPHVIAQKMKASLEAGELKTTRDLADLVEGVFGRRRKGEVHPATTVFQALRIAVNDELEALDRALESAPRLLKPGGRLVVISYHSLEDRRVKHAFRDGERPKAAPRRLPPPPDWRPTWKVLTRQPVRAQESEIAQNPRARSAKMRAAQRAGLGGYTP
jgi:16S rRNA (cytosine1402-N4)-methyltransferase